MNAVAASLRSRLAAVLVLAVTLAAICLPLYADPYTLTTFIRSIYFGFVALSVTLLLGQGGMISLAQTVFFAMTGYSIGLLGVERGLAFPWPELIGLALVLTTALLFALVLMRTFALVFLMLSLALGQIAWSFARQNSSLLHGWAGFRGIRPPVVAGVDLTRNASFYWLSLALFALALVFVWRLIESPFGLALNGIRDNPRRMKALGFPVYWQRVVLFVLAALLAGVGGILAAWSTGIVTPSALSLNRMIWILLIVILGGARHFWGPVLGTVIAVWLDVVISQVTPRYITVIGVIFALVILVAPNGILGIVDRLVSRRVRARAASAGPGA